MSNNKAFKVKNGLELADYNKSISDTAVDVFVYDTRKDSDGGAWRKRTQHTSWYNETLNTATRGSRKEFPAVAVIVAESNQVTIYDGDDPDLLMWSTFSGSHWLANNNMTSVVMKNGILAVGNSSYGLREFNFIKELALVRQTSNVYTAVSNAFNDHTSEPSTTSSSVGTIANSAVNDVAMTVLPNAPIDATTGLPVPTIAVATDGGVSVIKDDGTVVDITTIYNTDNTADYIDFTSDNRLYFCSRGKNYPVVADIPSSDISSVQSSDVIVWPNNVNTSSGKDVHVINNTNITDISSFYNNGVSFGGPKGVILINNTSEITGDDTGVVAQVTSDYNTGYQVGDIKLATLSDTDATNVTGSELVTNGTFDTDTSGWTAGNGATLSLASNTLRVTNVAGAAGYAYQSITTVVGKRYVASATLTAGTSTAQLSVGTTSTASNLVAITTNGYGTFVATTTTTYIRVVNGTSTSGQYSDYDNISVRLAEADRSVNNNGLQVFGTVTKSAVATGADLVAYSGFSTSNYLQQPVNADLQFGTGDFCAMGWFKTTNSTTEPFYFYGQYTSGWVGGGQHRVRLTSGYMNFGVTDDNWGSSDQITSGATYNNNTWHHYCGVRRGNQIELYADGVLVASAAITAATGSISNTGATLWYGNRPDGNSGAVTTGSLALSRISATAPSPEQILKIYNDEKVLFQEGAKAVLAGTSDAVTSLAYDDDQQELLVGTSQYTSVFRGLRRVEEISGSASAISASNGLRVIED